MKKFVLFCVLFGLSTIASAQELLLDQYSADQVISDGKNNTKVSKVYLEKGKMRSETTMGPMQMVTIVRFDEKIVYVMLPVQKIFVEKPLLAKDGPLLHLADKDTPRELVGTETVKGQNYDKYKVTVNGSMFYVWIDKNTHAPMQIVSADNVVRIENIQAGPQPVDLFKPPADYRKFTANQVPPQ